MDSASVGPVSFYKITDTECVDHTVKTVECNGCEDNNKHCRADVYVRVSVLVSGTSELTSCEFALCRGCLEELSDVAGMIAKYC